MLALEHGVYGGMRRIGSGAWTTLVLRIQHIPVRSNTTHDIIGWIIPGKLNKIGKTVAKLLDSTRRDEAVRCCWPTTTKPQVKSEIWTAACDDLGAAMDMLAYIMYDTPMKPIKSL